jgi:hypothetical protein
VSEARRSAQSRDEAIHTSIRLSLIAGAAVPIFYFGAQALAAPFFPGFSVLVHSASVLGSDLSSRPAILNGGAALTGTAALLAAYGLFRALRGQGVWLVLVALVAACSVSIGLASLWAASHPLPDPRHSSGALGVGAFGAPFVVLLSSLRLRNAAGLKWYLIGNLAAFLMIAAVHAGLIPLDLRLYGGAVQRLGALVTFVPTAALCVWLLRSGRSDMPLARDERC